MSVRRWVRAPPPLVPQPDDRKRSVEKDPSQVRPGGGPGKAGGRGLSEPGEALSAACGEASEYSRFEAPLRAPPRKFT